MWQTPDSSGRCRRTGGLLEKLKRVAGEKARTLRLTLAALGAALGALPYTAMAQASFMQPLENPARLVWSGVATVVGWVSLIVLGVCILAMMVTGNLKLLFSRGGIIGVGLALLLILPLFLELIGLQTLGLRLLGS